MRSNTLAGIALAVVVVAGLFAASYFGSRPAGPSPGRSAASAPASGPADAGPSPEKAAAGLPDDFVGQRKIGSWLLACNPPRELPRLPAGGRTGNSSGAPPREEPPPPGWKLPRCVVGIGLRNPRNPREEFRVTFRTIGFKRVLTLFLRFPPSEVSNGDVIKARFDAAQWDLAIRTCSGQFCLVIESIKKDDVPFVENAKSFTLSFKPQSGPNGVTIPVPTKGLAAAIEAMRRLNH